MIGNADDQTDLLDPLEDKRDSLICDLAAIEAHFIPSIPGVIVHRTLRGVDPITVWREYRGLTIPELAARAKVSEEAVTHAETGAPIDRIVLGRLAEALETTADELVPRLWD